MAKTRTEISQAKIDKILSDLLKTEGGFEVTGITSRESSMISAEARRIYFEKFNRAEKFYKEPNKKSWDAEKILEEPENYCQKRMLELEEELEKTFSQTFTADKIANLPSKEEKKEDKINADPARFKSKIDASKFKQTVAKITDQKVPARESDKSVEIKKVRSEILTRIDSIKQQRDIARYKLEKIRNPNANAAAIAKIFYPNASESNPAKIDPNIEGIAEKELKEAKELDKLKGDLEKQIKNNNDTIESLLKNLKKVPATPEEIRKKQLEYLVAYRQLTSAAVYKGPGGWPSLLHKGSNYTLVYNQQNHPVRDMLAVYWKAATDAKMEAYPEIVADQGGMANVIQASTDYFISNLAFVRRAHQDDVAYHIRESKTLDVCSCPPGTEGRILVHSSFYNKLTSNPPLKAITPYLFPEIRNYLLHCVQQAKSETKIAIYNILVDHHICQLPIGDKDDKEADKFLFEIKNNPQKLFEFLATKIPGLTLPLSREMQKGIVDILNIQLLDFKEEPDGTLLDQAVRITSEAVIRSKQEVMINETVTGYLAALSKIADEMRLLKKSIDNYTTRGVLFLGFLQSTNIESDLAYWREQLNEELSKRFKALPPDIGQTILQQSKENVETRQPQPETQDAEQTKNAKTHEAKTQPIDPEVEKIVEKINKNKKALSAYSELETLVSEVTDSMQRLENFYFYRQLQGGKTKSKDQKDLPPARESKLQPFKLEEVQSIIPPPPYMRGFKYDSSPKSLALNFIRLAFNSTPENVYEMGRLIDMMFDEDLPDNQKQEVMYHINTYFYYYKLSYNHLPLEQKQKSEQWLALEEAELLSKEMFKQRSLKLDGPSVRVKDSILLEPLLETRFSHKIDEVKIAFNAGTDAMGWRMKASKILESDPAHGERFENFYQFILLTMLNSLAITEIQNRDAESLRDLCKLYLGIEKDPEKVEQDLPYLPDPDMPNITKENATIAHRILALAKHLTQIIKTLMPFSGLFNEGYVSIISSSKAEEILKEEKTPGACLLRVPNSRPKNMMLSWIAEKDGDLHNLEFKMEDVSDRSHLGLKAMLDKHREIILKEIADEKSKGETPEEEAETLDYQTLTQPKRELKAGNSSSMNPLQLATAAAQENKSINERVRNLIAESHAIAERHRVRYLKRTRRAHEDAVHPDVVSLARAHLLAHQPPQEGEQNEPDSDQKNTRGMSPKT